MHFIAMHVGGWMEGAAAYGVLAYASRTIPIPANPWAKWIVGVLQFALSNVEKGQATLNAPAPEVPKQ